MELVIMGSINLSSIVEAVVAFPWIRMAIIFGFSMWFYVCVGLLFADKLLFPAPSSPTYEKDENIGFLNTTSGLQIAYKIWEPSAESKGTILYSHGNGEDLGMIENAISPLVEEGYTCVSYDYPGYGHSSGKPSEQGCYEAIDAVFTKLIQDDEIYKSRIVLWGRSLGTGPSCYLAAREKVAGLLWKLPSLPHFVPSPKSQSFPGTVSQALTGLPISKLNLWSFMDVRTRSFPSAMARNFLNTYRNPKLFSK